MWCVSGIRMCLLDAWGCCYCCCRRCCLSLNESEFKTKTFTLVRRYALYKYVYMLVQRVPIAQGRIHTWQSCPLCKYAYTHWAWDTFGPIGQLAQLGLASFWAHWPIWTRDPSGPIGPIGPGTRILTFREAPGHFLQSMHIQICIHVCPQNKISNVNFANMTYSNMYPDIPCVVFAYSAI